MALADWDARLLSPARALELAGDWPVYYTAEKSTLDQFDLRNKVQVHQRCGKCHQSITALAWSDDMPNLIGLSGAPTTPADQLSDVVRHLVTAHNLSLSGARRPEVGAEHLANHERDGTECVLVQSPPEDHARFIDAITEAGNG